MDDTPPSALCLSPQPFTRYVLTRERMPLPDGARAVTLEASTQPPALFAGTSTGRLFRIPLPPGG